MFFNDMCKTCARGSCQFEWNGISFFDCFRRMLVALCTDINDNCRGIKQYTQFSTFQSQRLRCDHKMFSAEISYHASRPEVLFGC
jgi:hypothetical protein